MKYSNCFKCGIRYLKLNNKQRFCGSKTYKNGCSWENVKELYIKWKKENKEIIKITNRAWYLRKLNK